jgi:diguanylate cyclase (GGDEF)-like protein
MSVAMFDLDRFKAVNDTYGHQAGDRVLIELAGILRETARDIDRLGRYGGEEFMALLPETCIDEAAVFVERVRREVARRTHFDIGGADPLRMTISAGVASYPHGAISSVETLVRLADEALYAAKAAGRDRVVRFDALDDRAGRRPGNTQSRDRPTHSGRADLNRLTRQPPTRNVERRRLAEVQECGRFRAAPAAGGAAPGAARSELRVLRPGCADAQ